MKEFNMPAPIPASEINRTAFIKGFRKKHEWTYVEPLLPHLQKLEDKGLVPQTLGFRRTRENVRLVMERVNGFELSSIPKEYEDYRFSVDLAKKTAALFQGFFEAGYYHADPHSQNIMYDQIKGRCVAVDLDSIEVKGNNTSLKDYVQGYSKLLSDIYLGDSPADMTHNMLEKGELQNYMGEEWDEFKKALSSCNNLEFLSVDTLIYRNLPQLTLLLMKIKNIDSKIHPVIKDFILRGLNPASCPESFDEILGLEAEAPERM